MDTATAPNETQGNKRASLQLPFTVPLSNGSCIVVETTPENSERGIWKIRHMGRGNIELGFSSAYRIEDALGHLFGAKTAKDVATFIRQKTEE